MVKEQWVNFFELSFPSFQQRHLTIFIVTKQIKPAFKKHQVYTNFGIEEKSHYFSENVNGKLRRESRSLWLYTLMKINYNTSLGMLLRKI